MRLDSKTAISFLFLWTISSFAVVEMSSVHCEGGGDGPDPFIDVTQVLPPGVGLVNTEGLVKDFIYWEKRQATVYRNESNELFQFDFDKVESHPLGATDRSLSRVIDENERYVTLDKTPTILDTFSQPFKWFSYPANFAVEHLYWHKDKYNQDSLYSIESVFLTPDQQQLRVLRYGNGEVTPQSCYLPTKKGEVFHIGQGHVWPYVFLYKVRKEFDGTRLTLYNIRMQGGPLGANSCALYKVKDYRRPIPGNVTNVYMFPSLQTNENWDMFVVRTDHPEKNFLWDDGPNDCRYYNFGNREPMILNHKQPVIATWAPKEGLSLVYPRQKVGGEPTILKPLQGFTERPILKQHLWLTDDGRNLLVAAQPITETGKIPATTTSSSDARMLFTVDLRKLAN